MKISQAKNVVEFYEAYTAWSTYRIDHTPINLIVNDASEYIGFVLPHFKQIQHA